MLPSILYRQTYLFQLSVGIDQAIFSLHPYDLLLLEQLHVGTVWFACCFCPPPHSKHLFHADYWQKSRILSKANLISTKVPPSHSLHLTVSPRLPRTYTIPSRVCPQHLIIILIPQPPPIEHFRLDTNIPISLTISFSIIFITVLQTMSVHET